MRNYFLLLLFLAGCAGKKQIVSRLQHNEARLFDVPLPLHYVTGRTGENGLVYKSPISTQELVSFYQEEMPNYGWRLVNQFSDIETNMIFEKPHKSILVSVRPVNAQNSQVNIFVRLKN